VSKWGQDILVKLVHSNSDIDKTLNISANDFGQNVTIVSPREVQTQF